MFEIATSTPATPTNLPSMTIGTQVLIITTSTPDNVYFVGSVRMSCPDFFGCWYQSPCAEGSS